MFISGVTRYLGREVMAFISLQDLQQFKLLIELALSLIIAVAFDKLYRDILKKYLSGKRANPE